MGKYKIEVRKSFSAEFEKIPKNYQKNINKKIARLENSPNIGKMLTGSLSGIRRIRIGDYRVAYKIYENRLVVLLLKAGHRKDFYEKLTRLVSEIKNL
jgi:mRNA interferase RelE/StbE